MDKITKILIIIAIVIGFVIWGFTSGFFTRLFSGPVEILPVPDGIILFYGQGCYFCKIVDDFIQQNSIEGKVKYSHLEVWYSKENQTILAQVLPKCNMKADSVGLPFLYDGKDKCYVGDKDVISFLKNEAGIQ
jgi:hypothetical protein